MKPIEPGLCRLAVQFHLNTFIQFLEGDYLLVVLNNILLARSISFTLGTPLQVHILPNNVMLFYPFETASTFVTQPRSLLCP